VRLDIWRRWRNRLLTNKRFITFAQSFPLTQPLARRRSLQLFDLVAGFSYSQVLIACVQLNLFERVGVAGMSLVNISAAIGWDRDKTSRLLKAAAALQLFDLHNEQVTLGMHGAALLGQPWIMRFIVHHPVALLSGAHQPHHLKSFWNYGDDPKSKAAYTSLMAASQAAVSGEILRVYDFSRHHTVMDVGGGDGSFLRALTKQYPSLGRQLFDLPAVIDIAESNPENTGTTLLRGNFTKDALPAGADAITLIRVAHDHDDPVVQKIFDAIFACLQQSNSPERALILAEPVSGHKATAAVTDAYFNLYFAAMGQGRTRTPAEYIEMAAKSGLTTHRVLRTRDPLITSVIVFRM
jgi:demethylspheroidene O-methyltransferase